MTKKRLKCYVVVRDEQEAKTLPKYIEGVFPLTEEGKSEAQKYAKELSDVYEKYKVREL